MSRLRDGSSLTVWPRGATVVALGRPTVQLGPLSDIALERLATGDPSGLSPEQLEQLAPHLADQASPHPTDAVIAARLAELDQIYGGTLPGFLEEEGERLTKLEQAMARRRVHVPGRLARPLLPYSVARRARVLESLGAARVALAEDLDGLSLLLAEKADVWVLDAAAPTRQWLEREAAAAGVGARLHFGRPTGSGPESTVEVGVAAAGTPAQTAAILAELVALTRPGGTLVIALRAPWEDIVFPLLADAGLRLQQQIRELDLTLVPGGFVLDGAGDWVLCERTAAAAVPEISGDAADEARAQPYYYLDLDELRSGDLPLGILDRVADLMSIAHQEPEAARTLLRADPREVLSWWGADGVGFSAELSRSGRHLLVGMMPHRPALEWAIVCAGLWTLGDAYTRVRPQLVSRWLGESMLG